MFVGSASFQAIIVVMSSGYMRHLMDKTCIYKITNPKSEDEKSSSTLINVIDSMKPFYRKHFNVFGLANYQLLHMFFVNDHFLPHIFALFSCSWFARI